MQQLPLWIKLAHSLFVCLLVPIYWINYGPGNFLWFSDIALFTTAAALWLQSPLLASMMALAVTLPELAWMISFFGRLIFGYDPIGLSGYMFDASLPLYLRLLSLFHLVLPVLLLWMVWRLGYDRRALPAQTALAWIVLPTTYLLTDPAKNINWVFGLSSKPQSFMPPMLYLFMLMALFPLVIYLPTHALLRSLFEPPVKSVTR